MALVDSNRRLFGVLAGHPDSPTWPSAVRQAEESMENARRELESHAPEGGRRGVFSTLRCGVSHGGGQTKPGNLQNSVQERKVLAKLNSLSCFKRISSFSSSAYPCPPLSFLYPLSSTIHQASWPLGLLPFIDTTPKKWGVFTATTRPCDVPFPEASSLQRHTTWVPKPSAASTATAGTTPVGHAPSLQPAHTTTSSAAIWCCGNVAWWWSSLLVQLSSFLLPSSPTPTPPFNRTRPATPLPNTRPVHSFVGLKTTFRRPLHIVKC